MDGAIPRRPFVALVPLSLFLTAALTGCNSATREQIRANSLVPPDFAIKLNVLGVRSPDGPLQQYAQYILEPDRQLRAATGRGADVTYYPPRSVRISPRDMETLYQHVASSDLTQQETDAAAEALLRPMDRPRPEAIVFAVYIRADGKYHRYAALPDRSPATTRLLEMLALLARGHAADADPALLRPALTDGDE